MLVYRELTAAVFLAVHDNITLPAVIWSYWYSGSINKASAVTLLMTLVLAPLIFIAWWFGRRSQISLNRRLSKDAGSETGKLDVNLHNL